MSETGGHPPDTVAEFSTITFGKWILAGEHAVIRGAPALVFPTPSSTMRFSWQKSDSPLQVNFDGPHGDDLSVLFWGVLEKALDHVERKRLTLKGCMNVTSHIPLGAGLGGSAALCVGVSRWFHHLRYIDEKEIYEFARRLENLFHGESSGVDIAVALEGRGLRFVRSADHVSREFIAPTWQPRLYLSYSGKRGVTSECVKRVKELWARSPGLGEKLDQQMREAVDLATQALLLSHPDEATQETDAKEKLSRSLDLSRDCFYQWGLCEGALDRYMRDVLRAGARSVKPTGSGGGGYVLSLWDSAPPNEITQQPVQWISLFNN